MNIKEHYTKAGDKILEILNKTLNRDDLILFSSNHAFINDFYICLEILKERPEYNILENAIKEYQIAFLSNVIGLYQQAFMGLRFFLERTLVAILFSAHEIELNLWKLGKRDTYWTELMDENKGIFSNNFCQAFFPELEDEIKHIRSITLKVYRECSEYVHANQPIIDKVPKELGYSDAIFEEWNEKASTIRRILLFVFCLRYLKHLKSESVRKVEPILSEEFKSFNQIMEIIS